VYWLRDTVVERWSSNFPCPTLNLSQQMTTYVGKPTTIGQPTRPTQPFILSGSINAPYGERFGGRGRHGVVCSIEILIKFLESRVTVFSALMNVIKITIPKMAATLKDELLSGAGIRHLTATSQYRAHRKQVPAGVSNIV